MPLLGKYWRTLWIVFSLAMALPVYAGQSLAVLIEKAINQHPSIAAAEANIASSSAQVETAKWQFYPTVSVTFETGFNGQTENQTGDDLLAQLNINQPLWDWGALGSGVDIAETRLTMDYTRLREKQWQLAESVIESYGKWLSSYLRMRAWQKSLDDHEVLAEQVNKRVLQGVSAPIDLALAEGRVETTEAEYIASQDAVFMAVQELSQLVSEDVINVDLIDSISSPLEDVPENSLILALTTSPKVKLAEDEVRLARHQLTAQEAQLKPDVYLRAEYRMHDISSSVNSQRAKIFVGMNGSSGAGLSLFSQRQSAEADLQAKQASLLAAKQSIEKNLESMIINVDSIQRRLKSLESAMLTNEAVADSYERQFLAGRKSWLEVMNAAREEVQMLVQIADLRAAYLVSSWRRALYIEGLNAVMSSDIAISLDITSQGE